MLYCCNPHNVHIPYSVCYSDLTNMGLEFLCATVRMVFFKACYLRFTYCHNVNTASYLDILHYVIEVIPEAI